MPINLTDPNRYKDFLDEFRAKDRFGMIKPKTNREAFALVIDIVGNQSALARGLGVVRQLVSRWEEIPPKYLEQTGTLTKLPPDWILPELDAAVSALLNRPATLLLPALIRLLHPDQKASPWPKTRKPRKPPPKFPRNPPKKKK